VTFNCMSFATDETGLLAGTCGKAPRGNGCGSDGGVCTGRFAAELSILTRNWSSLMLRKLCVTVQHIRHDLTLSRL
jgi:hypothetical protein